MCRIESECNQLQKNKLMKWILNAGIWESHKIAQCYIKSHNMKFMDIICCIKLCFSLLRYCILTKHSHMSPEKSNVIWFVVSRYLVWTCYNICTSHFNLKLLVYSPYANVILVRKLQMHAIKIYQILVAHLCLQF